ncbi:MAG: hypothetical protein ACYDCK_06715 [Thermoplasmatota archaeon]
MAMLIAALNTTSSGPNSIGHILVFFFGSLVIAAVCLLLAGVAHFMSRKAD